MIRTELPVELQRALQPLVRTLQIIVAALVTGCAIFLAVAIVLGPDIAGEQAADEGANMLLTYAILAVIVPMVVARAVLPKSIAKTKRKEIAEGSCQQAPETIGKPSAVLKEHPEVAALAQVYMSTTVVGAALLEGAAMAATVAFLLEQAGPMLIVIALLIAGVGAHFPTLGQVVNWIERELEKVQQQRELQT